LSDTLRGLPAVSAVLRENIFLQSPNPARAFGYISFQGHSRRVNHTRWEHFFGHSRSQSQA